MTKKIRSSKKRKKTAELTWDEKGAAEVRETNARFQLITQLTLRAWGVVDKNGKLIPREPVLSEKALACAKKIVKSKRLSIKFLMEGGFIDRPCKLHRNYR